MRVFVGIFVILALVMTTGFPVASHAMVRLHDSAMVEQARGADEGECHKKAQAEQSDKMAQNDKDSGKCCDKGMCKCIGSVCHSGLSKNLGNGSEFLFRLTASKSSFAFTRDVVKSALSNRLKRPPRA